LKYLTFQYIYYILKTSHPLTQNPPPTSPHFFIHTNPSTTSDKEMGGVGGGLLRWGVQEKKLSLFIYIKN